MPSAELGDGDAAANTTDGPLPRGVSVFGEASEIPSLTHAHTRTKKILTNVVKGSWVLGPQAGRNGLLVQPGWLRESRGWRTGRARGQRNSLLVPEAAPEQEEDMAGARSAVGGASRGHRVNVSVGEL